MDKVQHTPGPWKEYVSPINRWIGNAETGEIVCDRPHVTYNDDRMDIRWINNVPLLTAAPDLLKALENLLHIYVALVESGDAGNWDAETETEVIDARAAIAKAKGVQA